MQAPFNQLCRLAFTGISQNKVTFSQSDLEAVKDSAVICEVGLLQATPSIISDSRTVYYNFIHLSTQEMLSAVYISRMPASEQISTFDSLFSDSRFSAVFQFYAAITKLRTSRPFLSKLPTWLVPNSVNVRMLDLVGKILKGYNEPLLVSLLHCLYEAQDPSLCQFVAEQLGNGLYLSYTSLTPVDSLAIGYFLSSVSLITSNAKVFIVDVDNCSLGDAGTKSLVQSICRSIVPHSTVNTHLNMNLYNNAIHEEGASHIAELLNSTSIVNQLVLDHNRISNKGLQTLFDALKQNKSLKVLSVYNCGLTNTGVASLADALHTNNTLMKLYIHNNRAITENGLTCLVEAVSRHSQLKLLVMSKHLGVDRVRKTINEARKRNELPDIEVLGW